MSAPPSLGVCMAASQPSSPRHPPVVMDAYLPVDSAPLGRSDNMELAEHLGAVPHTCFNLIGHGLKDGGEMLVEE